MRTTSPGLSLTLAALSGVSCGGSLAAPDSGAAGSGSAGAGSGGTSGGGSSGGGTSGGTSGGGTGGGGAGDCARDLSGTWDIIAIKGGETPRSKSWVLVLGADGFSITGGLKTLSYVAQGTKQATWQPGTSATRAIAITNAPAALNVGSIPLALGGSWTFASGSEQCAVSVASGLVMGSCLGRGNEVGTVDWPYPVPDPTNGLTYTATQTATLPSQLGDLGGMWQATNSDLRSACFVTVDGNQFSGTCSGAQALNGTTQLTLGTDCVLSGMTSGGFEVSARRR